MAKKDSSLFDLHFYASSFKYRPEVCYRMGFLSFVQKNAIFDQIFDVFGYFLSKKGGLTCGFKQKGRFRLIHTNQNFLTFHHGKSPWL